MFCSKFLMKLVSCVVLGLASSGCCFLRSITINCSALWSQGYPADMLLYYHLFFFSDFHWLLKEVAIINHCAVIIYFYFQCITTTLNVSADVIITIKNKNTLILLNLDILVAYLILPVYLSSVDIYIIRLSSWMLILIL